MGTYLCKTQELLSPLWVTKLPTQMGGIIRALIRSENMQIYNIYPKYISSINTLSKTIYWTSIKHVERCERSNDWITNESAKVSLHWAQHRWLARKCKSSNSSQTNCVKKTFIEYINKWEDIKCFSKETQIDHVHHIIKMDVTITRQQKRLVQFMAAWIIASMCVSTALQSPRTKN